ncbi:uncharacterized protein [Brachyistius frenatus]|uniref:uncharacterized protein n=1 Tax=Brachyistius frenatus TaxID=100188 RepID=UPI0037E7FE2F
MQLYFYFLLMGCFCLNSADVTKQTVLQHTAATLPCPHAKGNVSWTRYRSSKLVTLVSIINGLDRRTDKRFSSLADNALYISNVEVLDTSMYMCNGRQTVYLEVTTDTNIVPKARPEDEAGGEHVLDSDQKKQQYSDLWKVPVGVVIGASLVLFSILILRFCSAKRAGRNTSEDQNVNEVIYEDIKDLGEQLRRESGVESPYSWSTITEPPNTCTPLDAHLYSTVNKVKAEGREACVYFLAQNPPQ